MIEEGERAFSKVLACVIDPLLATGSRPVARERALARRGEINALYASDIAAYGEDQVHVRPGIVDRIVGRMVECYVGEDAPEVMAAD